MASAQSRLPAHITEEDIRLIARVVGPDLYRAGWNAAIDAALTAVEEVDSFEEVPFGVASRLENMKLAPEQDQT